MEYPCFDHAGHEERLKVLERQVSKLFSKWDSLQKIFIGILVSMICSFIGIIAIFFKVVTIGAS